MKILTSTKVFSIKSVLLLKPEHIGDFINSLALSYGLNLNSSFKDFFGKISSGSPLPLSPSAETLVCW